MKSDSADSPLTESQVADVIDALPLVVQFDLSGGETRSPTGCRVCDVIFPAVGAYDDRVDDLLIAVLEWHSRGVSTIVPKPDSILAIVSYLRCLYIYECASNSLLLSCPSVDAVST